MRRNLPVIAMAAFLLGAGLLFWVLTREKAPVPAASFGTTPPKTITPPAPPPAPKPLPKPDTKTNVKVEYVSIEGSVHDAITDAPITEFEIGLAAVSDSHVIMPPRPFNDPQGLFKIDRVECGHAYRIVGRSAKYTENAVDLPALSPGKPLTGLVIKLDPLLDGCTVEGFIHMGNAPVQANVLIRPNENPLPNRQRNGNTDEHGWYHIEGVPLGEAKVGVSVKVIENDQPYWFEREVSLDSVGVTLRVDIDLPALAGIEGCVQIEGQAAAPEDCMITAHVKGTTLSQDLVVRADNSGCYRFPAVLPGKVEITVTVAAAQGAAERRKNATLDIPEGQTVRQDFTFSGLGGIRGTVAGLAPDQNGGALLLIAGELSQPLASFEDIANLRKRVLMDTSVDQSGAFEFSGLDPGVYTIVTVAANDSSPQNGTAIPNMRMASAVVSVAPNADTVVNLVFK